MKTKMLFSALIVGILLGCSSSRKSFNKENNQPVITKKISLSNSFKSFWRDLTEEAGGDDSLELFVPSQALIEHYSLREQDHQFFVSGFLHTDSSFNKEDIEKLGGNIVRYTETIGTFSIPIKNIALLIQLKGITYIEINKKVRKREIA